MDSYNLFYEQALSPSALDFLETSSMTKHNTQELGSRIQALMKSPYYSSQVLNHSDERGWTERIGLKETLSDERPVLRNLHEIQCLRGSRREFKAFLNLNELAACLLNAYFVVERYSRHSHHLARRSIASGGALFPIDLYYISLKTQDLETGIYAYRPLDESFDVLAKYPEPKRLTGQIRKVFPQDVLGSWDMDSVSGILVFGAVLNRATCKYGDRGLRFVLMDVGAICQNLYLSVAAAGLACCAIGGYLDRELDRLMGFHYPDERSLLTMFVGK